MTELRWEDRLLIGITSIDEQHKQLVLMLARLQNGVKEGHADEAIAKTLRDLVDYTKKHFSDEEALMLKQKFPELEYHKKLHYDLTEELVGILQEMKKGRDISGEELINFLRHWLFDHILKEDKKIAIGSQVAKADT
jgi:hemerythrin-like metal-binding protein